MTATCGWVDEDECWETACGLRWVMLNADSLKANQMIYCPKCGKEIKETRQIWVKKETKP